MPIYEKSTGKIKADLIALAGETFDESEDLLIFDPIETWKKTLLTAGSYTVKELMVQIFRKGICVYDSPSVSDIKKYCENELNTLWDETRRLVNPHRVHIDLSDKLYDIKKELLNNYGRD